MVGTPGPPSRVRARPIGRRRLTELAAAGILSCLAFVGLFPYLYMLETAVKSTSQFNSNEATPALPVHFGNFVTAWRDVAPYLLTSIIVAACAMFGCILLGSITAFVLARYRFPGRNLFFVLIALLLLVPNMASLVPLFVLMRDLHLLNSYPDLIIPQLTTQTVLAVVLMKTYIEHLPKELFDAAQIDGASPAAYLPIHHPASRTTNHRNRRSVRRDLGVERLLLARAHHRHELATHGAGWRPVLSGPAHDVLRPALCWISHREPAAAHPVRGAREEFLCGNPGRSCCRPVIVRPLPRSRREHRKPMK